MRVQTSWLIGIVMVFSCKNADESERKHSVPQPEQRPSSPARPAAIDAAAAPKTEPELALGVPKELFAGRVGFDWLSPGAGCTPMETATLVDLIERGAQCEQKTEGLFRDEEVEFLKCRVDKEEWFYFGSAATCKDEYETMEANGP